MTTENTEGQQPNPGDGSSSTDNAANPDGKAGTDSAKLDGQGESGDGKATDTGKDGKGGEGKDTGTDDGTSLVGAPDSYEQFKLPENFVLEGTRLEMATSIAKEFNLSQAGAQKLIDTYTSLAAEDAADLVEKVSGSKELLEPILESARRQDAEKWGTEAKAELGAEYDAKVALARTAVQAVQSPKLIAEFDRLGWGNHPELLKAFAFFGSTLRDTPMAGLGGDGGNPKPSTDKLSERMYPNMK